MSAFAAGISSSFQHCVPTHPAGLATLVWIPGTVTCTDEEITTKRQALENLKDYSANNSRNSVENKEEKKYLLPADSVIPGCPLSMRCSLMGRVGVSSVVMTITPVTTLTHTQYHTHTHSIPHSLTLNTTHMTRVFGNHTLLHMLSFLNA